MTNCAIADVGKLGALYHERGIEVPVLGASIKSIGGFQTSNPPRNAIVATTTTIAVITLRPVIWTSREARRPRTFLRPIGLTNKHRISRQVPPPCRMSALGH